MSRDELGAIAVALAIAASAACFVGFQVCSAAVVLGEKYLERRGDR